MALRSLVIVFALYPVTRSLSSGMEDSPAYIWPLPLEYNFGNQTLSVDHDLLLSVEGGGRKSEIIVDAFHRLKKLVFKDSSSFYRIKFKLKYDINRIRVIVHSDNETLYFGVDESYSLYVALGEVTIEAKNVYGALHGLETFSQLCVSDYQHKSIRVPRAPWYIRDKPRFPFRGLLLDTSRHYFPVGIIKHVIESMSYAKLNVLHWHIIDEQSFPVEIPSYPKLWNGAYTKWERYSVEDAYEIVDFAKRRGIHVMAEMDVPGHAESWGIGYPGLWPSSSCREPLDVSKNFTFDLISGILTDLRKIFPFEFFHLGGDEVNTGCWNSTPHINKWLEKNNMTVKSAYGYFVHKAQEIAISKSWTPVNWEETLNVVAKDLHPQTVIHNWLGSGACPQAVAKGFRCIFSNQGVWYLDHLDVPWEDVYNAEPLEGIDDPSMQALVLGGEVCMWGETVDASNVQQTIWPRAAAASERLWSGRVGTSSGSTLKQARDRMHYFRCLLNRRNVEAAPVGNKYGRSPPKGPGSCYEQ